jgi:hypothetical protein
MPAPQRTTVSGSGTSDGGDSSFFVVGSTPADGTIDVPLGSAIRVVFSDFPDEATLFPFGALVLHSGPVNFDYTASVDLPAKAVVLKPRSTLTVDTRYDLELTHRLGSLSGAYLATSWVSFRTGTTPGGGPTPPTPRTLASDVQPILDARCAFAGCHDDKTAAEGLSLSAARAATADAGGRGRE